MDSLLSNDFFVVLELKDPNDSFLIESDTEHEESFISTEEISTWNLTSILSSRIIKLKAHGNRLIEESSYFCGLLAGNFSESCLDCVSVQWNLEAVIDIIRFIYGCPLHVTTNNFISLLEGALFFGVEALLLECKTWLSEVTSSRGQSPLQLPSVIEIWNFGLAHDVGFIQELCTEYLAQNFMLAISCGFFGEVPYSLLCCCLTHQHLTVDSEIHLVEALLLWLESNMGSVECSSTYVKEDYSEILKVVRFRLLPLWFAAGKKRNCYFSKLAKESTSDIFSLINDPWTSVIHLLKDGDIDNIKIRLTDYTERVDISGCPQMTVVLLHLSMLPSSYNMDPTSRKRIAEGLINLKSFGLRKYEIPVNLFPISSFGAVHEVDVSKCPQLQIGVAITCFSKSFPALRTMRASYCLHFQMNILFHLALNCPLVNEVDFTADISPALPTQVSTLSTTFSSNTDDYPHLDVTLLKALEERPPTITKLILEGRSDINDVDLRNVSLICGFLSYLNLKGCTSLTDVGISKLIFKCANLQSLVVSDTYLGGSSILALCSDIPSLGSISGEHHQYSTSLASRLLKLHMSGCKSVDVTSLFQLMSHTTLLQSLCLRGTILSDHTLYNFKGSSLKRLDVSDTMVSRASLVHTIKRNPGLKHINSSGCRNMCDLEDLDENTPYNSCSKGEELYFEIGKTCSLESVSVGWGFSSLSFEHMGPAISSLKVITVGLGASLSECALMLLPVVCPLLESLLLRFQVISDNIVKNIIESCRHLQVLGLHYCLGDLSSSCFLIGMPCLRTLKLERVTPWMTNDDLVILAQNCIGLVELSLSGCLLLNTDSQQIISCWWPGLVSIHLEDCGEITSNGVSSLFDCKAIEDLSLRHNGPGIQRNFIINAASKMPMLRKLCLDLCDASDGGFDSPSYADRYFLSIVTIARCKVQKCAFDFPALEACRKSVHKETIVLEWNRKGLRTSVVKERV